MVESLSSSSSSLTLASTSPGVALPMDMARMSVRLDIMEERGGDALVRDVGHDDAELVVLAVQNVEEVAPHVAGRLHLAE